MSVPNPLRLLLLWIGNLLAAGGLADRNRMERTVTLSWPRIVTGIARMSKSAADVAMVGVAVGSAAIAGVGFATPFWALVFSIGAGVAGGTIGMVSQRYGAGQSEELRRVVLVSVYIVLIVTIPLSVIYHFYAPELIGLLSAEPEAHALGAEYLQVIALGVPFAALNLVGSRVLIGADDSYIPMVLRVGGAITNLVLNVVLIFIIGLGVTGAALGTIIGNVLITVGFTVGFLRGGLPFVGEFPVTIDQFRPLLDKELARDLVEISTPLAFSNMAGTGAQFPMLYIVGLFGTEIVAAFVIALRVRDLLNTPGWGFSLASSSLVGQELGTGAEQQARAYSREIIRFAGSVYMIGATFAFIFAEPIARMFVDDPATLPLAVPFVQVAAVSVIFWGISGASIGPLQASGDTRWPLYAQLLGRYGVAIPLALLGAVTPLGLIGLYLALLAETVVPAAVNYYRVQTERWVCVSRDYRPETSPND
nr:MATE family efflux transporter [Salinarchaeum sp. IM2453]